ncbi:MAG TPA: response regulator transcription factor [Anaerolineales bacterium]|nr:response regulator transcription factor [Anaerolineales bacterium]
MDTERIRVLIADDHPLFRDGMHGLLDSVSDTKVVGEAASGEEAITLAENLQPDVILMDIKMPGINGLQAMREILHTSPHIRILIVSMLENDDSVFAAMKAGARGYVPKGANQAEMLRAIRAVANGEAIFGPGIAQRLIGFFSASHPTVTPRIFPELTDREGEILELIAQGRTNQEIAEQLVLSLKTVRNHVSNIFSKLQVADRAQAVLRAQEAGLGKEPKRG